MDRNLGFDLARNNTHSHECQNCRYWDQRHLVEIESEEKGIFLIFAPCKCDYADGNVWGERPRLRTLELNLKRDDWSCSDFRVSLEHLKNNPELLEKARAIIEARLQRKAA